MELIDLSHPLDTHMPRFPGFPEPAITPYWTHEQSRQSGRYQGCTCEVTQVSFVTSMGTYLDAPYHFDPSGIDIADLPLERCVLPGMCWDLRSKGPSEPIVAADLEGLFCRGKALLLCTGWSRFWGDPAYFRHPHLGRDAVEALIAQGVALVGIDTLVIDDTADATRPAHSTLLPRGIPIVENLTGLEVLLGRPFLFIAVPPRVRKAAAFPVRAFAVVSYAEEGFGGL